MYILFIKLTFLFLISRFKMEKYTSQCIRIYNVDTIGQWV